MLSQMLLQFFPESGLNTKNTRLRDYERLISLGYSISFFASCFFICYYINTLEKKRKATLENI